MTVELVALCEAASVKNGSVSLLHTFANVQVQQLPGMVFGCLVATVRFLDDEDGDHRMRWEMIDDDGNKVWESPWAVTTINVNGRGVHGWPQMWVLNAEVRTAGQHELILLVDEKPTASLMLAIISPAL